MNKIQSYKIEATLLCTLPIKVVYHIHADSEEEAIEEIKTIGHKMIPSEVDLSYSDPKFYDFVVKGSFIETYDYGWDIGTNDRHS